MATAAVGASGQEPAGNHNLDTLQSMLNLIFIQSGRFIKEHQAGGGNGRQQLALQRAVPAATERFHDALDELEKQVRQTQMVLRRDLALLRHDRKQKEAAARLREAEQAKRAAELRNPPIVKAESPIAAAAAIVSTPPESQAPAPAVQPADPKEPERVVDAVDEPAAPPPIVTTANPERDPLFDGTPTTANPQEPDFDFDAMFGDAMDTSADNNETSNNHNMDGAMDTSADLPFNIDEEGNDGPSLLRGLEDFAKSNDDGNADAAASIDIDFPMPDLPDLNATDNTTDNTTDKPQPGTITKPPEPAPVAAPVQPSTEEAKDTTAATDDYMTGSMGATDLDDLLNMDDYANPENSLFDDAFFDLGN